jgi:dihydroorotate dehydrogenase electron transfer subunit
MARDTYRLRLRAEPLAAAIQPGQFIMLRLPKRTDPLLGRAFALYDTIEEKGRPVALDVVYHVIGKMTGLLAGLRAGDEVEAFGPLGQPFPEYGGAAHLIAVGGGIGQTPLLALLKRALGQKGYGGAAPRREVGGATFYYGVRSDPYFAGLDDFAATGALIRLATDDGSRGHHGFVTAALETDLLAGAVPAAGRWVGCGPPPMMQALAELAARQGVPCDLSLETPMACGVGICFSCVMKVKVPSGWDYRRVCVEGPVFPADKLIFD